MTLNSSVNNIISDNKSLGNLCQHLEECQFVCIDTEFMREGTYWPNLCLIQLADPGGDTFIIDPLAPEIEIKPFPNSSGFFDHLFASEYPIKDATVPPSAGNTPINDPIPEDLKIVIQVFL